MKNTISLALAMLIFILTIWLFNEYSTESESFLNPNIFIVVAICFVYFLTKCVAAHKAVHFKITTIEIIIEKAVLPVFMILLISRYTAISGKEAIADARVWILIVLLADPSNVIRKFCEHIDTVQSGKFLRPLVSAQPNSHSDYIPAFIALIFCYIALWWR